MRVINSPAELKQYAANQKKAGKTIGLVPTMGYLHRGHCNPLLKRGGISPKRRYYCQRFRKPRPVPVRERSTWQPIYPRS